MITRRCHANLRRGFTLLELLVALPIVALIGTICVQLLMAVHRRVLHDDGWLGATRELRQPSAMLASELRNVRPLDVISWSDTAIEFESLVASAIVCHSNRSRMAVTLAGTNGELKATQRRVLDAIWSTPAQAGDRIKLWTAGASPLDAPREMSAVLRSTGVSRDCDLSPLQSGAPTTTTQLLLADTLSAVVIIGTPARIIRRTRYSLYRASDNDFYVGRRTLGVSGWDVIQPVAGPLLSARDRGLVITVRDSVGARIAPSTIPSINSARVSLELRAPRKAGRATLSSPRVDSTFVDVALRSAHGGAP